MTKRLLYALLTIGCFILFYSIIPLDLYDNFFYFLVIVGGVLTTICLGAFAFSFPAIRHPEKESNFGCVYLPLLLVFFIGLCVLLIFHEDERENKELETYGRYTEATITDGSSFSTNKTDFTHLTLEFTAADGQKCATDHSISKYEFDKYYQDQKIPIVYSTRYPQILKIMRTAGEAQQFIEAHKK